jgi:hypothetical protein
MSKTVNAKQNRIDSISKTAPAFYREKRKRHARATKSHLLDAAPIGLHNAIAVHFGPDATTNYVVNQRYENNEFAL